MSSFFIRHFLRSKTAYGAVALATLGAGALALADTETSSRELIVRFRAPQNSHEEMTAATSRMGLGVGSDSKIVNEEEGVASLSFRSPAEAKAAAAELMKSDEVLHVAPNLLYTPAVKYQIQPARPRNRLNRFALPFAGMIQPLDTRPALEVPEVLLPSGTFQAGADPLLAADWAVKAIGLDKVLNVQATKQMVTAVIDTGVDYNHEDLIGAMWRKPDDAHEVGYDFAHNIAKPFDQRYFDIQGCVKDLACSLGIHMENFLVNPGHGTHCAGHVGAVAGNSVGIRGIGAGAPIMALKFFYNYGEEKAGHGDDAAAIKSIDYAIKNGAKVISASWGGRVKRDEAEESELRNAIVRAQQAGVLFVVAAGNDTIDQDKDEKPSFPAAYDLDNLIVVAASDKDDKLASFSNFGAKSVHLAAPGARIFSTTTGGKYSDVIATFQDAAGNPKEIAWDGTSMAAPIVAGAAALVWSKYPNETYLQIKERLLKSVRKSADLEGKVLTGGVLDVAAALGQ